MKYDYLIVGAGFAGCTLAERLANILGKKVLIVEKRNHIGGNCFDRFNNDGIMVQVYGPHIFHTKVQRVWEYLNQFTTFNHYQHRVLSHLKDMDVYFPINLDTMERVTGLNFTSESLKEYFAQRRVPIGEQDVRNSRDVVLSQVGEEVYNLFVKEYTKKQWGVYPEELDPQVLRRIPVRFNRDTRYFDDPWQGIPTYGYSFIFEKMVVSPLIHLLLKADYKDVVDTVSFDTLIYTGPIDDYFNYVYGKLPYRCMRFEFETLEMERFQGAAVVNYPLDKPFTRITEYKHFYMQEHRKTTISYEYSQGEGEPSYPIPRDDNRLLYEQYKALADQERNTFFIGRLAQYQYFNMDRVVEEALNLFGVLAKVDTLQG